MGVGLVGAAGLNMARAACGGSGGLGIRSPRLLASVGAHLGVGILAVLDVRNGSTRHAGGQGLTEGGALGQHVHYQRLDDRCLGGPGNGGHGEVEHADRVGGRGIAVEGHLQTTKKSIREQQGGGGMSGKTTRPNRVAGQNLQRDSTC